MWKEPVPFNSIRIEDIWFSYNPFPFKGHPYFQFVLETLKILDLVAQCISDALVGAGGQSG